MANKKRTRNKKKSAKSRRGGGKKVASAKERTGRASKKSARKKPGKKAAAKRKAAGTKASGGRALPAATQRNPRKSQRREVAAFSSNRPGSRSGEQSGDLQGLSHVQGADSASVQELLEEGNAFEAGAVKGVEDAGEHSGREVHTHEVPADDVPDEYLDKE